MIEVLHRSCSWLNRKSSAFLSTGFRRRLESQSWKVCLGSRSYSICPPLSPHITDIILWWCGSSSFPNVLFFPGIARQQVDTCHPFSVFLSVSGTLFRPLPYLRVAVFLPSGLFFTLSTKQINVLLVFNFQSWTGASVFPSSCLFWLFLLGFPSSFFFSFFFTFFFLCLSFFPVILFLLYYRGKAPD